MAHYLPAAVGNPSLASKVPAGNSYTPSQYAAIVLERAGISGGNPLNYVPGSALDTQTGIPQAIGGAASGVTGWLFNGLVGGAISEIGEMVMVVGLYLVFVLAALGLIVLGIHTLAGIDPRQTISKLTSPLAPPVAI